MAFWNSVFSTMKCNTSFLCLGKARKNDPLKVFIFRNKQNRLALGMTLKISRVLLVYNQYRQPSTKKGTPFLRFPLSCCQAYIRVNGITCVQSTQRRCLDCCSEQCVHLACQPCSDHSYSYSFRPSHCHDRCYPLKHSGWLVSCCFHPYSLHIPLDEPYRSGSCCYSGYRH